jgi:hypothetical protein
MFDHVGSFQSAIVALERERRYRVFADLERQSCSIAPTCLATLVENSWAKARCRDRYDRCGRLLKCNLMAPGKYDPK